MHKLDERGSLLIPLVVVILLFITSLSFGLWAFAGRQDYKNNVDEKITEAVAVAKEALSTEKDAEFAKAEKLPYRSYNGPSAFGTLRVTYPKTWSAYVDERGTGSSPLSGYLHPGYVPATASDASFAFRFEVTSNTYEQVMQSFVSLQKSGKVNVSAYRLPMVQGTLGSRVEGSVANNKQGVMVVLPLRDKTIKIWTEGQEFRADFDSILKDLTFIP